MKKRTKIKILKGALGLTTAAVGACFTAGELLNYFALNRKGVELMKSKVATEATDDKTAAMFVDAEREYGTWFDNAPHVRAEQLNRDGESIFADIYKNETESSRWLICIHGYTGDTRSMSNFGGEFAKRGYNILFPHMRGHDNSVDDYISMGWLDRLDVISWVDYIVDTDPQAQIVINGVSMGGATVMMVTGEELPSNVVCAIEDCGYTSVWDEFNYQISNMFKLPSFPFLNFAELTSKYHGRIDFKEASAIEQIKKSKTPTLFIHGEEDGFVPFEMVYKLYDAASCEKEMLTVPGAGHGVSCFVAKDIYFAKVFDFVKKYVKD